MKTFSTALAAAYASGSATLCVCLRVLRQDGVVATFTSADINVIVGGETYIASTGLDVSNLVSQSGLAVDNMDLTVLPNETSYPQLDILAGRWDFASFWLFECDYTDSSLASGAAVGVAARTNVNLLKRGTTGDAETLRTSNRFEFRGLKQALQQPITDVTTKTCRLRLGDANCRVNLAPYTFVYAVTAVASRQVFTCSAATQVDDYFKEGSATATDGLDAGYGQKVKGFSAGVFTLSLPLPYPISVGDHVRVVAGCQKRHSRSIANPAGVSDCLDKFNNVLNFGGEPHMPGNDLLTADPVAT